MVPIGSWEELWFPRVINRCSPTPPPALHLQHSAHHIDSIYNDSRQLEWSRPEGLPTRSLSLISDCGSLKDQVGKEGDRVDKYSGFKKQEVGGDKQNCSRCDTMTHSLEIQELALVLDKPARLSICQAQQK